MTITSTTRAMVVAGNIYNSLRLIQEGKAKELQRCRDEATRCALEGNLRVFGEMDWPSVMNVLITLCLEVFDGVELPHIARIPGDTKVPLSEREEVAIHEKSKKMSALFIPQFRTLEQEAVARLTSRRR